MSKKVAVIGTGFSSLSAACFLAKAGYDVHCYEKNSSPGGRARKFEAEGFVFDMGPSWYWMPDVFENFFSQFGKKVSDYYDLERLDPSYRVVFGVDDQMDVPADLDALKSIFESLEPGSGDRLDQFLEESGYKYKVGMQDLVMKPGRSLTEFLDLRVFAGLFRLHMLKSISSYIKKYFKHPKIIQLLEFPVLFLGAKPENTPALYSLMNYADISLGTWYPKGGMFKIVEGMVALGESLGVTFHYNSEVEQILVADKLVTGLRIGGHEVLSDYVVAGSDYHHTEQHLLEAPYQNYDQKYWDSRVMAPSCLIYYLGINKKVAGLLHHNLFFDAPFSAHATQIYEKPQWPDNPLFYVSCPSKTDPSVAPEGKENIFILIPIAPGLEDDEGQRVRYFKMVTDRIQKHTGVDITNDIIFKRDYAMRDFISDYHAFKGNAYGLANTLKQTAILKPSIKNKKLKNLYFTGQLTVPGPGVPPSLISGQVVAGELIKDNS